MGVTDKIKDKLSGSSSQNKLEKEPYDSSSGGASHLQHPIQNSGPTGTAVSSGDDGYGPQTGSYSNQPGAFSSSTTDRVPGSYGDSDDYSGTTTSSSTAPRQPHESATGPRQPYDPYSRKGQQTAAGGLTSGSSKTHTTDYGRSSAEDPSLSRSRDGGILNQTDQQRYSSGYQDTATAPYQSQPSSQHHYGRDAAIAGGTGAVGAGGVGAYEMGRHQDTESRTVQHHQPGGYHQSPSVGQPQDVSYMNRSSDRAHHEPSERRAVGEPNVGGSGAMDSGIHSESAGLAQARKMGGAYEAGYKDGYRDATEHLKSQKY